MKRVIVETINNKVNLHFHPKLKEDLFNPVVTLDIEV